MLIPNLLPVLAGFSFIYILLRSASLFLLAVLWKFQTPVTRHSSCGVRDADPFSLTPHAFRLSRSLTQGEKEGEDTAKDVPNVCRRIGVGLIIAHPDDESMFFSPTLKTLTAFPEYTVHILCFSTGNADGLGTVRVKELNKAGTYLGVHENDIEIVDHPLIQDGFHSLGWTPDIMVPILSDFAEKYKISVLISFDDHGVSGHPNHGAVSSSCRRFVQQQKAETIALWELVSFPLGIKFLGPIYAAVHLLYPQPSKKNVSFLQPNSGVCLAAMRLHSSQWVWFRWGFVAMSVYPYLNVLAYKEIHHSDQVFKDMDSKKVL